MKIQMASLTPALLLLFSSSALLKNDTDFKTEQIQMSCLIYEDLSFYDLRALQSESTDYSVTKNGNTYYFNLCAYTFSSCVESHQVFAYMK